MASKKHASLSPSSAERWLACPPSAVASAQYPNDSSSFAIEGTIAHKVAEQIACGIKPEDIKLVEGVDKEMVENAVGYGAYLDELSTSNDTARLLEVRVSFDEWVLKGFGTCDCCLIDGTHLTIVDYKYGVGVPVSAKENPQMRLYALGALNEFGFLYDIKTVSMRIYQPRINNISADEMTAEELLTWAEETVKPTALLASEGKGDYKAGSHCKFCKHAGKCRELAKVCNETIKLNGKNVKVPKLAPFEVAEILKNESMINSWIKAVKTEALKDMLDGKEIPGYKVVEGRQGNRKWTDEDAVFKKLEAEGYKAEDVTETLLLSPSKMDKALGKKIANELVGDLTERSAGQPTIAPESDRRQVYNRLDEAIKDFK